MICICIHMHKHVVFISYIIYIHIYIYIIYSHSYIYIYVVYIYIWCVYIRIYDAYDRYDILWLTFFDWHETHHDLQWGRLHVELLGSIHGQHKIPRNIFQFIHFNVDKNGESKNIYFELRLWWDVKLDLKPFTLHLLFTSSIFSKWCHPETLLRPMSLTSGVRRAKTQVGCRGLNSRSITRMRSPQSSNCKVAAKWDSVDTFGQSKCVYLKKWRDLLRGSNAECTLSTPRIALPHVTIYSPA